MNISIGAFNASTPHWTLGQPIDQLYYHYAQGVLRFIKSAPPAGKKSTLRTEMTEAATEYTYRCNIGGPIGLYIRLVLKHMGSSPETVLYLKVSDDTGVFEYDSYYKDIVVTFTDRAMSSRIVYFWKDPTKIPYVKTGDPRKFPTEVLMENTYDSPES